MPRPDSHRLIEARIRRRPTSSRDRDYISDLHGDPEQSNLERVLPIRLRPLRNEDSSSYLTRLLNVNYLNLSHFSSMVRATLVSYPDIDEFLAVRLLAERKGGLSPSFLEENQSPSKIHEGGKQCPRCTVDTTLYLCMQCTKGDVGISYPILGAQVCAQHHMWIGLESRPSTQCAVAADVVSADALFQTLVESGRVDLPMLLVLRAALREDDRPLHTVASSESDAHQSVVLVAIAVATTSEDFVESFYDPDCTFEAAHNALTECIRAITSDRLREVVDALWRLFRPTFLGIREHLSGSSDSIPWEGHNYGVTQAMCRSWNAGVNIAEDFTRYFEPENAISVASDPAFHTASGSSTDFGRERKLDPLAQITPGRIHSVRAFYSQLGWDVLRNGDITTSTRLRDDPIVGWTCHSEHNFALSVSDRLRGFGCSTCWPKGYSILAIPFTIAHPLAWRDWDYSANGARTPDRIFPGADESVTYFWLCPSGHRYQHKARHQARIGSACNCPSWASSPRLRPRSLYYSTGAPEVENGRALPEPWARTLEH